MVIELIKIAITLYKLHHQIFNLFIIPFYFKSFFKSLKN